MSNIAPTFFYVICGIIVGMYVPQAWGAVLLLCVTCELYTLLKIAILRAGSIRINHIWIGLPGLALAKGTFLGIPCQYSALPLYPFIDYTALGGKIRGSRSAAWWRFVASLWAIMLSIGALLSLVTLLASLAFWSWGYPGGQSAAEVSRVQSGLTIDGVILQPGDQMILVGSIRATDSRQVASRVDRDATVVFLRNGTFLPPVDYSAINRAIASGSINLTNRPITEGIRVRQVLPNSAAFNQGLHLGDILLVANTKPLRSVSDLVEAIDGSQRSRMSLQVSRDGVMLPPTEFVVGDPRHNTLGLIVDPLIKVGPRPIRLRAVVPRGPSAVAGLMSGDVVLCIDNVPIESLADFQERTAHLGKAVSLTVYRRKTVLTKTVNPALVEGSDSSVGVSAEEVPLAALGLRRALAQGVRFGWYSLSVPIQLLTQLGIGLADPHGIYGVWSSFLSWGPPPLELGSFTSRSWWRVQRYFFRLMPAFLLSAVVPFMVLLEYMCCIRMLVAGIPGRWVRLSATALICVGVSLLFYWLASHDKHLLVFEFPSFDDRVLTVRSLWRF
jgi:membrane-associated protease RseP (regulator of RpoE activity)